MLDSVTCRLASPKSIQVLPLHQTKLKNLGLIYNFKVSPFCPLYVISPGNLLFIDVLKSFYILPNVKRLTNPVCTTENDLAVLRFLDFPESIRRSVLSFQCPNGNPSEKVTGSALLSMDRRNYYNLAFPRIRVHREMRP